MERKVPGTSSEEIELYLRTIYSLLRSSSEFSIRALEEVHTAMKSSLHPYARKDRIDTSAFIYTLLRLPECIWKVHSVVLGQNAIVFRRHGYPEIEDWQPVSARARRRRCYFDGDKTLACFIASRSDIDDVIPNLVAYQIEWNKLNYLLKDLQEEIFNFSGGLSDENQDWLAGILGISRKDIKRLITIWGAAFIEMLHNIRSFRMDFHVRLLSSSLSEYWRATRSWWDNINRVKPEIPEHPVYFISSNMHSITNIISGFAPSKRDVLLRYLEEPQNRILLEEWEAIQNKDTRANDENFLYHLLKKYQQSEAGQTFLQEQTARESEIGISRVPSEHSFDVDAQVISLNKLDASQFDTRLKLGDMEYLKHSNALILNIDYPLGFAAYHILCMVAENVRDLVGVYIMGKSAILNGVPGDILIPNVVYDEHSKNTYLFDNVFSASDINPYLIFGNVLDNQKSVSVMGTFLQNKRVMDVIYREGYTDIEMEAGPYLSAMYEMVRPKRHPVNELVNLYGTSLDIGILHYASDKPINKGKNLGAGTLSYAGLDSTYAASVAIMHRIFKLEEERLSKKSEK